MKYYNVEELLKVAPDCSYYIIIGQRANGKSTSVGKFLIDECEKNGSCFGYFSRKDNISIVKDLKEGNGYFSGFLENYANEKYHKKITTKKNAIFLGDNLLCKQFTVSLSGKYKSKQYDENYKYIVFEEFVSDDGVYLKNEWLRFNSIVSTLMRHRDGKIFLIGNTISRFNPYFENLGIDIMSLNLKEGEHYIFETPEGAKVCIDIAGNHYESAIEISNILKVKNNNIATKFEWQQSKMIVSNDIIDDISKMYKKIPLFIIMLQDIINESTFKYIYYLIVDEKNTLICSLVTQKILVDEIKIDTLDISDLCFYIDVNVIECIRHNVKSYVDLQKFIKSLNINILNLITLFDDDRIAHNFKRKLKFTDISEVGDCY